MARRSEHPLFDFFLQDTMKTIQEFFVPAHFRTEPASDEETAVGYRDICAMVCNSDSHGVGGISMKRFLAWSALGRVWFSKGSQDPRRAIGKRT